MEAEVLLSGITRGRRLRVLDKGESGRVGAEKLFNRGRRRRSSGGCHHRFQEFQKLCAGAGGEKRSGVADDIGVDVLSQIEANGYSARASIRIGIRDLWQSGRVGEADRDWRGGIVEMRSGGELFGLFRRSEYTIED